MISLLLTVVALHWTNPAYDGYQSPYQCYQSARLCTDLATVEVWGNKGPGDWLLATLNERGREGQARVVELDLSEGDWRLWFISTDLLSNRSCSSNIRQAHVAPPPPEPPMIESGLRRVLHDPATRWYDLTGRHIAKPTRPGVYFIQPATGAPRRLVVLK